MKKRIYMIDYLKALAIIMVIVTHYDWADKIKPGFLYFINMAVPIFMIITGYNFAMSGKRRAEGKIANMYRKDAIIPKLIRFTTPFIFIYILEIIFKVAWKGNEYSVLELIGRFFQGGWGPGSYYFPILLQLIFVFPLVFYAVNRWKTWGVVMVAGVNFAYEVILHLCGMPWGVYRCLMFRYLLLLAFGCWMALYDVKIKNWLLLIMMVIGGGFLWVVYYTPYEPVILTYWTRTCMVVALYIFPIVYWLLTKGKEWELPGWFGRGISLIGQASYHIFLVQMVFFHFDFCDYFLPMPGKTEIAVHVVLCCIIGYAYYVVEGKISSALVKATQKKK